MSTILKVKESWHTLVAASAGLGLALYWLFAHHSTTTSGLFHPDVTQEDRQDYEAVRETDDMDPKERMYHEAFMREAINMVKQHLHL